MKLAEALAQRADSVARLHNLSARLKVNAKVQEGEIPAEDPAALLAEHDRIAESLEALITQINTRNLEIQIDPGYSMTKALARRDVLRLQLKVRTDLADTASISISRVTRSELRTMSAINVQQIRQQADLLARELRILDTKIQQANWNSDLESDM